MLFGTIETLLPQIQENVQGNSGASERNECIKLSIAYLCGAIASMFQGIKMNMESRDTNVIPPSAEMLQNMMKSLDVSMFLLPLAHGQSYLWQKVSTLLHSVALLIPENVYVSAIHRKTLLTHHVNCLAHITQL